MVGKAVAVGQRQVEGGMAADGKEQLLVGGVVHLPADAQGVATQGVAEVKHEGEGVVFAAFAAVFEAVGEAVFVVFDEVEILVARETVLRQAVVVAVVVVAAVFEFADDGKENGRAATPVARVALPEVFALAVDEALQFAAVRGDGYGEVFVFEAVHCSFLI